MSLRIQFSAPAEEDVEAAKAWYAEQPTPDLDLHFKQDLDETLLRIERFPSGYAAIRQDVRKANLHRFPYTIFFRLRGDELLVVAVLHHARDPSVWQRRP